LSPFGYPPPRVANRRTSQASPFPYRATGQRSRSCTGSATWIENEEEEERAFRVDGKALHVRDTLVLEDASS